MNSDFPGPCRFRDIPQPESQPEEAPPPTGVDAELPGVRGINDIPRSSPDDGTELLRHRLLCRKGGGLIVGPTGVGKSSLTMQCAASWAIGRPAFGITPVSSLRILLVQAENDDGDIAEMRDGVISGMSIIESELTQLNANLRVATESARSGFTFLGMLDRLLGTNPIDILILDNVFAYLGCDASDQQGVSNFLRAGLNPLLRNHNCAVLLIHHTNKPLASQNRHAVQAGDYAYFGAGSAEFGNWSRMVIALKSIGRHDVFELKGGKRGQRIGWKEADGITPRYSTQIAHSTIPGQICWHELASEDQITPPISTRADSPSTAADMLMLVPAAGSIAKTRLVELARERGIGLNRANEFINELVDKGDLLPVQVPRARTRPAISLMRAQQPSEEIRTVDTHGAFNDTDPRVDVQR
jgi:hypothetical protein